MVAQPTDRAQGSRSVTVVGGGIAGLVAAIEAAERGLPVRLLEAHEELGGRARAATGPFAANFGPHALYKGRANWRWLAERRLLPRAAKPPSRIAYMCRGRLRHSPPPGLLRAAVLLGRQAPVNLDFRSWAAAHAGEGAAAMLCAWAGAFTFDHDPGRLSAAFVWERMRWLYAPPAVRHVLGGWGELVRNLHRYAVQLGVVCKTGARVQALPEPPVVVATEVPDAIALLGEDGLAYPSADAVLLDVGLVHRRGDPPAVLDLDHGALVERVSACDRQIAPQGHDLIQAHIGIGDSDPESGVARIEEVLDAAFAGWRERAVWRRRQLSRGRTGAVDLPGRTWRDRPAIDRGSGIFLAGDTVAAPGVLSEVSFESGQTSARMAGEWLAGQQAIPVAAGR